MKKTMLAVIFGVAMAALAGCSVFSEPDNTPPPDYNDIAVTLREGREIKDVVRVAATQRGWSVREVDDNVLRLTIEQRANLVEVNAVMVDDSHYSLRLVSSNIPKRKYIQWINNLTRTVDNIAVAF